MNLHEYQKKAYDTAIYLKVEKSRLIYPALGLVGECGEVAEKIKKLIRDDNWKMKPDRIKAIMKELGDCCWYLANICSDTNLNLNTTYKMKYIGASSINDLICSISNTKLPRIVLSMNRRANIIAEILEYLYYSNEYRFNVYDEISQNVRYIIMCIEEIASRFGHTLEDVYTANIEKLARRQKDGKLTGDGDER